MKETIVAIANDHRHSLFSERGSRQGKRNVATKAMSAREPQNFQGLKFGRLKEPALHTLDTCRNDVAGLSLNVFISAVSSVFSSSAMSLRISTAAIATDLAAPARGSALAFPVFSLGVAGLRDKTPAVARAGLSSCRGAVTDRTSEAALVRKWTSFNCSGNAPFGFARFPRSVECVRQAIVVVGRRRLLVAAVDFFGKFLAAIPMTKQKRPVCFTAGVCLTLTDQHSGLEEAGAR